MSFEVVGVKESQEKISCSVERILMDICMILYCGSFKIITYQKVVHEESRGVGDVNI